MTQALNGLALRVLHAGLSTSPLASVQGYQGRGRAVAVLPPSSRVSLPMLPAPVAVNVAFLCLPAAFTAAGVLAAEAQPKRPWDP